jgi:hypothetical protein
VKPEYEYSYGRQNWFPCADYEAKQLMTDCAFFDRASLRRCQGLLYLGAGYRAVPSIIQNAIECFRSHRLVKPLVNPVALRIGKQSVAQHAYGKSGTDADRRREDTSFLDPVAAGHFAKAIIIMEACKYRFLPIGHIERVDCGDPGAQDMRIVFNHGNMTNADAGHIGDGI